MAGRQGAGLAGAPADDQPRNAARPSGPASGAPSGYRSGLGRAASWRIRLRWRWGAAFEMGRHRLLRRFHGFNDAGFDDVFEFAGKPRVRRTGPGHTVAGLQLDARNNAGPNPPQEPGKRLVPGRSPRAFPHRGVLRDVPELPGEFRRPDRRTDDCLLSGHGRCRPASRPGVRQPCHSTPGLGSHFSAKTPSARSGPDFCNGHRGMRSLVTGNRRIATSVASRRTVCQNWLRAVISRAWEAFTRRPAQPRVRPTSGSPHRAPAAGAAAARPRPPCGAGRGCRPPPSWCPGRIRIPEGPWRVRLSFAQVADP